MIQIPVDCERLYKHKKVTRLYFYVQYFKRDFEFLLYNYDV